MLISILFCLFRKGEGSPANLTRCSGAPTANCQYFDQCAKTVSTFLTLMKWNILILDQSGAYLNSKGFLFVQVEKL